MKERFYHEFIFFIIFFVLKVMYEFWLCLNQCGYMLNCIYCRSHLVAEVKKISLAINLYGKYIQILKWYLLNNCHKHCKTIVIFRIRRKFQIRISVQIWDTRFTVDQCYIIEKKLFINPYATPQKKFRKYRVVRCPVCNCEGKLPVAKALRFALLCFLLLTININRDF